MSQFTKCMYTVALCDDVFAFGGLLMETLLLLVLVFLVIFVFSSGQRCCHVDRV